MLLILLIAGIVVLKLWPRNQGLYKVTILPSLVGESTFPLSINDKGQVAGYSEIARGVYHLFLWDKENGMQDLGLDVQGNVYINNSTQIAANMLDPNGNHRAFILDTDTGKTFLPLLGGKYSDVKGLNNHGQIVGWADTSTGIMHAYIWDKTNGIHDLTPTRTGNSMFSVSINDSGQVVIYENNNILLVETDKELETTSLPIRIGFNPQINNNGYITGIVKSAQNKLDIVSWHPNSGLKSLYRLNSACSPKINDHNQIIITDEKDFNPIQKIIPPHLENYLLDPKIGQISLDGYFNLERNENLELIDINNNGCIIGVIRSTKGSKSIGVLFEPIPEKWNKYQKTNKTR